MNKKVLFVSHVADFQGFNWPFMDYFKDQGYEVHYASQGEQNILHCDKEFVIPMQRNPLSFKNIKSISMLRKLIKNEKYDLIHCHTPMGGVVARLAAKKLLKRKKIKVIYTAHGFHFFKGSSKLSWLLYYRIEKRLSKYCNAVVTINNEDYNLAKENFKTNVFLIDGVGVSLDKLKKVSKEEKSILRDDYNYKDDDFILIMIAEYTLNKNHKLVLECANELKEKINNLKILFAGIGDEFDNIKKEIEKRKLNDTIYQLGFRKDIPNLLAISDALLICSYREGLPINLIECEACGVIPVASRIRGVVDVIGNDEYGFLYDVDDKKEFINKIMYIYENNNKLDPLRDNIHKRSKKYSVEKAIENMDKIYNSVLTS